MAFDPVLNGFLLSFSARSPTHKKLKTFIVSGESAEKKSHKRSNFRDFLLPRDEKSIKYRKHVYRFEKFERSFAFITKHLQMREPLADNAGEGIYESSRLKS